jgi:hypothetical protein
MNLLTILREHIAKHQYKRGAHKGTAPADHTRRGRTHERLIDNGDHVSLRFHYTDIIKVFEDRIVLDTNGYHSSPTTRTALSDFMGRFMRARYPLYYITSDRTVNGPCITRVAMNGERTTFAYYDHMAFDIVSGEPVTPLRRFTKTVADREARKAWRDNPQVKTWRSLLPVLVSGIPAQLEANTLKVAYIHDREWGERMLSDNPDLAIPVINRAYTEVRNATRSYDYLTRTWITKPVTAAMVWAYINRTATSHLTKLIDTGKTSI